MPTKSWNELMQDAGGAGGNYDPIPDGDYDFLIEDCEAKTSQNGKMMYVAKNKVESGPHAGRLVWHNHVISHENPNALAWFFRNMQVLGLGQEFFAANPSDHQVAEALKGKRFRGAVSTRKWQGQDKNEVKQFYTAGAGTLGNGLPVPQGPVSQAAPVPQFAQPPQVAPGPPPAAPVAAPVPAFAAPPPAAQPQAPIPAAAEAAPPPPPPIQQQAAPAPVAPAEPPAVAPPPAPAPVAPAPPVAAPGAAVQATGEVPAPPPF